jgi:hypothetical protein
MREVHSFSISDRRSLASTTGEATGFFLCSTTHKWPDTSSIEREFKSRRVSINMATYSSFSGTEWSSFFTTS